MNQTMTNNQYNLLDKLNSIIQDIEKENSEFKELIDDADIFGQKVDDLKGEIERRIEIFEMIKKYEMGEIKDTASIGISNTMGVIIMEAESDYVFGYMPFEDGYHFFLSEVEYKLNEDDEPEPMFTIGEDGMELSLNNAMRI